MTVDVMTPTGEKLSDAKMYSESSGIFHNYTVAPQQKMIGQSSQPIINGLGPGPGPIPSPYMDHSLQTDLPQTQSPGGVSMYEQDNPCGLVSPVSDKNFSLPAPNLIEQSLDNKPNLRQLDSCAIDLFELEMNNSLTLEDSWLEDTRGDPLWSPPADKSFKVEDVFQCDHNIGPTLAQLNSPAEITAMFEFIEKKQMPSSTAPLPATSSGTLPQWQTVQNPNPQCMTPQTSQFPTRATTSCSNKPSHTSTTPQNNYILSFPLIPSMPPVVEVPSKQSGTQSCKIPAPATSVASVQRSSMDPVLLAAAGSSDSLDRKWDDIKEFMQSEQDQLRAKSEDTQTEKTDCAYEPNDEIVSHDEGFGSDSDSENEEEKVFAELSSEGESADSISHLMPDTTSRRRKNKRFFWQYNTQSKGPKGKRLCSTLEQHDPHILDDFTDPVFDPSQSNMRYKHSGKARRGEGNDVNPNPKRLFQIGNELNRLNREIHDMTPVSEQPSTIKPKSRREKNKLASRACRLKKKAQHEANKVKLHGLEREHHQLMELMGRAKYMPKKKKVPTATLR